MQCPECKFDNRDEARFCGGCGKRLEQLCPGCGNAMALTARFCDGCGTSLGQPPTARPDPAPENESDSEASAPPAEPAAATAGAERRQLSVMFCDLVGSTSLSQRLDPEDLRDLLAAYQQCCAVIVGEHGGVVARYVGDGILVYFGYPTAHEDDPRRCVRAALHIVEAAPVVGKEIGLRDVSPNVRIGIATGLVVVGDIGAGERHEEMGVVGETPNIAARLQAIAEPGMVVVAGSTRRLVQGLFEFEELGGQRLRGIAEVVAAYRVVGESSMPSEFEARARGGLSPLVGRDDELAMLLRRWEDAKSAEGAVAVVEGQAGVGKSRLLRAMRERVAADKPNRILLYCSQYQSKTAYYPLTDQIERALRFEKYDDVTVRLNKIEAVLDELQLNRAEHVPVLAALLSVPVLERYPPMRMTPKQLKNRTFELIASMIERMARGAPVLMIVEDAQWADPSTLELLEYVPEQLRSSRFLMVVSTRGDTDLPWLHHPDTVLLRLGRLTRRAVAAMVEQMAGDRPVSEEMRHEILKRTDGVPLFVEELTKTVLESDLQAGVELSFADRAIEIPASLHDLLMARLDRLSSEVRDVAQLAATIGRGFNRDLLAVVTALESTELERALAELVACDLIYRRTLGVDASYEFKHALVRDVAYESLLRRVRQKYHLLISDALTQRFPKLAEAQPELLAQHYMEGGLPLEAIQQWNRAARRATQRSANVEAIHHFEQALKLVDQLPEGFERGSLELEINIGLGPPMIASRGWAAPQVARVYNRATELSAESANSSRRFPALKGAFGYHLMRGELRRARELGEELTNWAQETSNTAQLLEAQLALGMVLFWLGEFTRAREQLSSVAAMYDLEAHGQHAYLFGTDPGVAQGFYSARTLWHLGFPEQALAQGQAAVAMAEELAHPHTLAWATTFAASLRLFRREWEATLTNAEATIEICREYGFPFWMAWGTVLRGWVLAAQGETSEGLAAMRSGLAAYRATGADVARPYFLTLMADAYGRAGQVEEGLAALKEALNDGRANANHSSEAEMYRLRGMLLLAGRSASVDGAEQSFVRALEIARSQRARAFELRAATALCDLWRRHGRARQAMDLLSPLHETFTEGTQTADVQEAATLLEALRDEV